MRGTGVVIVMILLSFAVIQSIASAGATPPSLAPAVNGSWYQGRSPDLSVPVAGNATLATPPPGFIYHGAYPPPRSAAGAEDRITNKSIRSYERAVGKKAAWIYFSHEWSNGMAFPLGTVSAIRESGAVPFIRLMARSDTDQDHAEPMYNLSRIAAGDFDAELTSWARDARDFGTPILVEFGTEVNGRWFSWNGYWNGNEAGPPLFRDAYRHIVGVMDAQGASNLIWVFHVDCEDYPESSWNQFENYYPGDDVVDWIGVSVYGPQTPYDRERRSFSERMDRVYPRLCALSPDKPIAVLEFGAAAGNSRVNQRLWAKKALAALTGGRWPRVAGFSWWNEFWENDNNPRHDTNMRVQDNPGLSKVFRHALRNSSVLGRPIIVPETADRTSAGIVA
jgi:Glycosyl hydrolase family 26